MAKRTAVKKNRGRRTVGQRPVLQFRVHEGLYGALRELAAKNRRTISEEAAENLSRAVGDRDLFPGIQQLAMLASGAFWHAGQRANGFEGYATTEWMKKPECYREAFVSAAFVLLDGLPKEERELAVAQLMERIG